MQRFNKETEQLLEWLEVSRTDYPQMVGNNLVEKFLKLSLTAKNVVPITAQCTVFAESEVISLVGEEKPMNEIAAGTNQQRGSERRNLF